MEVQDVDANSLVEAGRDGQASALRLVDERACTDQPLVVLVDAALVEGRVGNNRALAQPVDEGRVAGDMAELALHQAVPSTQRQYPQYQPAYASSPASQPIISRSC